MILEALARGSAFIGYDLPAPTRGFRFTAQGKDQTAQMGDEIRAKYGLTFQIRLPRQTECRLLKDGKVVKMLAKSAKPAPISPPSRGYTGWRCISNTSGAQRGWIFSNPIYVKLTCSII